MAGTAMLLTMASLYFGVVSTSSPLDASQLPSFALASEEPPRFEIWTRLAQSGEPEDIDNIRFPLQETSVDAFIANGVAQVKVTQVYRNDGKNCLQSRYIFPLPIRAAISAMSMVIGNRTIVGEIRKRSKAREEFEAARDAGSSASLLEQERPNVFTMDLANILPGETTTVAVEYSESLSPIDGVFAFTFPTVVGPRYGKEDWAAGTGTSNLTTRMNITVSPPCLGMVSTLELGVTESSLATRATLSGKEADMIVKFWFTEKRVSAQLLVSKIGSERYFSLGIQPPQRRLLQSSQISKREYLFILDTSGSMTGYPIDLSKRLMKKLLRENVRPGDFLNIMCFAGGSAVFSDQRNVEATSASVGEAETWLDQNMKAGGSTELLPALRRAFSLPRSNLDASRTIVIMTDGYVSVEREAFDIVRRNLGTGNVFVFGIGQSVNRYIIDGLARVGYGEPFVVMNETEGDVVVGQFQRYIDTPVLTGLDLKFENGTFSPREQEPPNLPDVFASRPIQVVGKWEGEQSGSLRLRGRLGDGEIWEYVADFAQLEAIAVPAVRLLWARARIAVLGDYAAVGDQNERAITELGLSYSLMTEYTSFVAVDSNPLGPELCLQESGNSSGPTEQQQTMSQVKMGEADHMLMASTVSSTRNASILSLHVVALISSLIAAITSPLTS
eukprot:TRINITY_DN30474_c0_g1_i1.p1 TRINITY_DN30474_c0_g1~~TRINITY_DN30474_c0_g1_i1.p1  ORF type:complete len:672 (+),score=91.97 TRINITY_DN30474_c0_g1_i1:69-2084(+)